MNMVENCKKNLPRLFYLLGMACFLLPFISVKSCNTQKIANYNGRELFAHDNGWIYFIALGIGLFLFLASFIRKNNTDAFTGFSSSANALLSSIAGSIIVFYPSIQFLFDDVQPRSGQVAGGLSWFFAYILNIAGCGLIIASSRREDTPIFTKEKRLSVWDFILIISAVLSIIFPVFNIIKTPSLEGLFISIVILFFYTVPAFGILYFIRLGVRNKNRWAYIWGTAIPIIFVLGAFLYFF